MKRTSNILKAIFVRIAVIVHIVFLYLSFIWQNETLDILSLLIFIGMTFICIEGLYTVIRRSGQDWKWGSPLLFIYISFAYLPCLISYNINEFKLNRTQCPEEISLNNQYFLEVVLNITEITSHSLAKKSMREANLEIFFLIIIFTRWSLPKGKITLEELSKLLLIYMSVIADILDMMKMVRNVKNSTCNQSLKKTFFTLSLCSLSLCILQLCLGLTTKRSKRNANLNQISAMNNNESSSSCLRTFYQKFRRKLSEIFENEVWGICVLLLVKDVPFSILRTYALIAPPKTCSLWNQSIFFTLKNYVTIVIQLNRCYVLYNGGDHYSHHQHNHHQYIHHQHHQNNHRCHDDENKQINLMNNITAPISASLPANMGNPNRLMMPNELNYDDASRNNLLVLNVSSLTNSLNLDQLTNKQKEQINAAKRRRKCSFFGLNSSSDLNTTTTPKSKNICKISHLNTTETTETSLNNYNTNNESSLGPILI